LSVHKDCAIYSIKRRKYYISATIHIDRFIWALIIITLIYRIGEWLILDQQKTKLILNLLKL
jgi:hypothetical protein